jgi:dipeptidyl aminopeptidase/acylaminoacyl peptidase
MIARTAVLGAALLLAPPPALAQTDLAAAFGARAQLEDVSLSPDGTRLAYIVPTTGQGSALLTVTPGTDAKPTLAIAVSGEPDRLAHCDWVSNDRLVCTLWGVVLEGVVRKPFTRMFAIDANGDNLKMLSKTQTPYSHDVALYGGGVIDLLPDEDGNVLMERVQIADDHLGTLISNSKSGIVVDKLNTRTLASSRVEGVRDRIEGYISDGHGAVRVMGVAQISGQGQTGVVRYHYRTAANTDWKPLGEYNYVDRTGFEPLAVDHERNAVYGRRKIDGRWAITRIALDGSMREETVVARPDVDVEDLIYAGRRHRVIGASYVTDKRHAIYFDADFAKLVGALSKALPSQPQVDIVDASYDEKKLLIRAGSDDDAGLYYMLDRTTHRMAIFQPVRPELEGLRLARRQPIAYPAADGTMIPAYLTLPPDGSGKGLPAIVMPHGGPEARDEWGFDWLSQYFAARGYATLQPNYRGSTGYGDTWFRKNGFRSWRVAIGDVTDAGRWLIKQGIADPAKLAIVGWSYGGYAALQSAVVDPALFKAVVAIAPVTDLPALQEQERWFSDYEIAKDRIGSGSELIEGSPARNAARIKAPVLLIHGTDDVNVYISQSRLMDQKLSEAGVPHQFIVFNKRDHHIEDSALRAQMLSASDAFLRKSMGM